MSEYLKEEIIEYIQDHGVADFIKKSNGFLHRTWNFI